MDKKSVNMVWQIIKEYNREILDFDENASQVKTELN